VSNEIDATHQPAGAQAPLASDTRTGGGDVNTLSFCRGVEVGASSSAVSGGAKNDLNLGATVTGRQQERAKPVDFRSVEGSYAGDHRSKPGDVAAASLAKAASNGGPRAAVGQAPFGRNTSSPASPNFSGTLSDSDAGN
jgi:hypothetical protein